MESLKRGQREAYPKLKESLKRTFTPSLSLCGVHRGEVVVVVVKLLAPKKRRSPPAELTSATELYMPHSVRLLPYA